jgi:NAD+ synthase (glutamine-hydrolysing)
MKNKLEFIIVQFNATVGDIEGNATRIIDIISKNRSLNTTKIFVFPELALCGYSPEDLLYRQDFENSINTYINKIVNFIENNEYLIFGAPRYCDKTGRIFNSAYTINGKNILNIYDKQALPNYGVFDEKRYFSKGSKNFILDVCGNKLCILVCEDAWSYESLKSDNMKNIDFLISINASPFEIEKDKKRKNYFKNLTKKNNINLIYLNTVGGQDEIVFDGSSFLANREGVIMHSLKSFSEEIFNFSVENKEFIKGSVPNIVGNINNNSLTYEAIKLGTKDYISKSNLNGVLIGLSGGIDSALTLAIAAEIFDKKNIEAILMPSVYTSDLSIQLAKEQCNILDINYSIISIENINNEINNTLEDKFKGLSKDITEENIQARARGLILMAISNKTGKVLLTTGNKSELAVGYSTLYGDMCGSFAPLKDLYKTEVFMLAKEEANRGKISIPEAVIERLPTAELSKDQYDIDTLPPYSVLDEILINFIENKKSLDEICELGFEKSLVSSVINMVIRNEYKRRQYAPGVKIRSESFGRDRRFPIVSKFKY